MPCPWHDLGLAGGEPVCQGQEPLGQLKPMEDPESGSDIISVMFNSLQPQVL